MKIIICGAGQVGASIAHHLAGEDNDVTVIDLDEDLIEKIRDTLDVTTIVGYASHPSVLERAGAPEADMIIAVTRYDEVNMVACQVAHSLFNVPMKIARVRNQSYLDPVWSDLYRADHLPIDVIISPEREVARAILRRLHEPGAIDMIPFAEGRLKVIEVRCMLDCPVLGLPLSLVMKRAQALKMSIIGVLQKDKFKLPRPDMVLNAGDDVFFVADNSDVKAALELFGHEEKEARRVIILGGGNVGLYVAQELEHNDHGTKVKVIESSRKRAEEIVGRLSRTVVINGSGLDKNILLEANADITETFIAVTNDDEVNILGALLAKRYGAKRDITLVNNNSYVPLLSNLGIEITINPRETTISSILQHVRRGKIRAVHSIRDGLAEIIEAEALETSPIIGKSIEMLELPDGVLVGAVLRADEVIIPDEQTVIHEHDRLIILSVAEQVRKVEKILSVSLDFF